MTDALRSGCPINLTLEVIGDRWSLLVIRDIIFGNRRHFRELLTRSEEGISSNILADRLKTLVAQGILTRADDPTHRQKAVYSLTEKAIELVPVIAQMAYWGRRHLPVTEELSIRAQLLEEIEAAGLRVVGRNEVPPLHPRAAYKTDPLHFARSAEITSLWRLVAR